MKADDNISGNIIIISEHAYQRAKERLSWSSKVLNKMALKAFNDGLNHKETKGHLRKYITKLWFEYQKANNIKIWGENIYLFKDNTLITLYQLPNDLRKYVHL